MKSTDLNDFFKGKTYVVTGSSSGIGHSVATLLSSLGANLVLIGRDLRKLEEIRKKLNRSENHTCFKFDLLNTKKIEILMLNIHEKVGQLSGLIYSSGISYITPLRSTSYDRWDAIMRVNLYSFAEMVKCFSLKKYSNSGSIVAISSTASTMPEKGQILYSSSKAALDASVRCMAFELHDKGIRINSIMPGLINTEMTERFAKINVSNFLESQKKKQLLGLGMPSDIANFVVFLLSDMAAFCTGRAYYADGGRIS